VGVKQEPTAWKVYAICLSERPCYDRRIGTIPRESTDVLAQATTIVEGHSELEG
jgi:hypothetical protein